MNAPTVEEVKALRGMEFVYEFSKNNGEALCGKQVDAYVAQADREKGISIMAKLPDGVNLELFGLTEDVEVVIQCCNSLGEPDSKLYISYLTEYIRMIKEGYFNSSHIKITEYDPESFMKKGNGDASYMADACPFQ